MSTKRELEHKMIGMNVAFYRKLRRMTQKDLAEKVGLSRTHISYIEAPNASTWPSLETLMDIADALGVTLSALVTFEKEMYTILRNAENPDFKLGVELTQDRQCDIIG